MGSVMVLAAAELMLFSVLDSESDEFLIADP